MKKYIDEIYAYDSIFIPPEKVKILSCNDIGVSTESIDLSQDPRTTRLDSAPFYTLENLTPEIADALLTGKMVLVFEVTAIDHTRPTANGKWYPAEPFYDGMMTYGTQNMLRLGGIPGEDEHPIFKTYNSKDPEAFIQNTLTRAAVVKKDTHDVIAWRQASDKSKTFFTIKTSINNLKIVRNLLNGKAPGFSIRVRAMFDPPSSEGYMMAKKIDFIAIDYVANPANYTSSKTSGIIRAIDPVTLKSVDLRIIPKQLDLSGLSTESVNCEAERLTLGNVVQEADELFVHTESETPTFIIRKYKKEKSFEEVMNSINLSILK